MKIFLRILYIIFQSFYINFRIFQNFCSFLIFQKIFQGFYTNWNTFQNLEKGYLF